MQPLRLILPGRYWDSQIYEGRLYLFGRSGDVLTLDWDALIDSFKVGRPLHLALKCAFQRSDYLYGMSAAGLMKDPEIRSLVIRKFRRLGNALEVPATRLLRHSLGRQDNPLPFPHTDSEIYARKMYVASKSGVMRVSCNKKTKYPVSTRAEKLWDGPVLGIAASYSALAMAAGNDGLFEKSLMTFRSDADDHQPKQISQAHCTDCGWAFYSIFGSSSLGTGFLAAYEREKTPGSPFDGAYLDRHVYGGWRASRASRVSSRRFDRVIDESAIFESDPKRHARYSWASQDKICRAVNGHIEVARYTPWKDPSQRIERIGALDLRDCSDTIVSAAVALFGIVVELDSSLVIIPSTGRSLTVPGEPVNWRVFPRSKFYENHLHVVYNDHLEVFSFNHDYLVDQDEKVAGIRYYGHDPTGLRPL